MNYNGNISGGGEPRTKRKYVGTIRNIGSARQRNGRKQMESTNKPFSTVKGFAVISGLSVYFVRQLIQENKIPFIRSGTKYYVNTEKALSILRGGEAG